jgi:glutamate-1-semialdehyde 2,1-aminomutase
MSRRSEELFRVAQEVLPGGVSRNTLLHDPYPFYAERGVGCRLIDVDGVERIDFSNNMASLIHGHAHPEVVLAAREQLERGTAFTMATEVEIEHARHLCGRSPGFDKVRFMNSGTEAVMVALKVARAFTGRPKIAKTEGAYHGAYDYAEVSQAPAPHNWGPIERPCSVPLAEGVPKSIPEDVVVLPFDDLEDAISILDAQREQIACVMLDLMPHRVGMIPAHVPFVRAIKKWTEENGALFVLDEVITFRMEVGGMQQRYGVQADITAMGKIIGGGFPVGAVAGRNEVMEVFCMRNGGLPRVPQSGTFSANPMTMVAGLTAMKLYDEGAVARLNELGDLARRRIEEAIAVSGAPASVTGSGSLFRIHLKAEPPTEYRSLFPTPTEKEAMRRFIDELYRSGIVLIHSGAGVLSTPMREEEIDRLGEGVLTALRAVAPTLTAA